MSIPRDSPDWLKDEIQRRMRLAYATDYSITRPEVKILIQVIQEAIEETPGRSCVAIKDALIHCKRCGHWYAYLGFFTDAGGSPMLCHSCGQKVTGNPDCTAADVEEKIRWSVR